MTQLIVPLPDTVSPSEARLCLAIKLFQLGRLSRGQAAELAGVALHAFLTAVGEEGLPTFDAAPSELAADMGHA